MLRKLLVVQTLLIIEKKDTDSAISKVKAGFDIDLIKAMSKNYVLRICHKSDSKFTIGPREYASGRTN